MIREAIFIMLIVFCNNSYKREAKFVGGQIFGGLAVDCHCHKSFLPLMFVQEAMIKMYLQGTLRTLQIKNSVYLTSPLMPSSIVPTWA